MIEREFPTQSQIKRLLAQQKTVSREAMYWLAFSQILNTRKTFTSEDLISAVSTVYVPDAPGWWGAMFQVMTTRAKNSGLIRKLPEKAKATRPSSRGRKLTVWAVNR